MKIKLPSQVQDLTEKPMDRKEFLKHTAAIAMFVAGGGMIVQSVLKGLKFGQNENQNQNQQSASMGYGSSAYGGTKQAS